MRIAQINGTCGIGSTGKICVSISELLTERGIENYILYTQEKCSYPLGKRYSGTVYKKIQALKSRIMGNGGFNSRLATYKLLYEVEKIHPDIIHIHNIHGHDCNLEMLFHYIKKKKIRLCWTFHDCWAFTANCTHFTFVRCDKWKSGCHKCLQIRQTSWFLDRSTTLFKRKKELLSGLDMTIVTPSQWLADLVKESFLQGYPVKVIHNGIDLETFTPTYGDFRKKNHCEDKFILLGVAFGWGKRKGLDVFVELAKRLDSRFQIVLVGTDEKAERQLPKNIISIRRTNNQKELAEIYTAADLFVNPTREENYPTVNMEAIACGTPVLTFRTGGSPEIIDTKTGCVVDCDDIDAMEREIVRICENRPYLQSECIKKSREFDMNERFKEYITLYENN